MVGPTCFKFLPMRFLGFRVTTDSLPSLHKSTCLPSTNALLIESRTVSTASLALDGPTPVFWTIEATMAFLVTLGIVNYEGRIVLARWKSPSTLLSPSMGTPVAGQTDGFKGKKETLCPLVIFLFMLVGDFFDESLSQTANGFESFGAFT
jgi:hypothetical protein